MREALGGALDPAEEAELDSAFLDPVDQLDSRQRHQPVVPAAAPAVTATAPPVRTGIRIILKRARPIEAAAATAAASPPAPPAKRVQQAAPAAARQAPGKTAPATKSAAAQKKAKTKVSAPLLKSAARAAKTTAPAPAKPPPAAPAATPAGRRPTHNKRVVSDYFNPEKPWGHCACGKGQLQYEVPGFISQGRKADWMGQHRTPGRPNPVDGKGLPCRIGRDHWEAFYAEDYLGVACELFPHRVKRAAAGAPAGAAAAGGGAAPSAMKKRKQQRAAGGAAVAAAPAPAAVRRRAGATAAGGAGSGAAGCGNMPGKKCTKQ